MRGSAEGILPAQLPGFRSKIWDLCTLGRSRPAGEAPLECVCGISTDPGCGTLLLYSWKTMRYRAFQERLGGYTIGETFGRGAQFLNLAAANAPAITGTSAPGAR